LFGSAHHPAKIEIESATAATLSREEGFQQARERREVSV
jgi:hypothetical protein